MNRNCLYVNYIKNYYISEEYDSFTGKFFYVPM